MSIASVVVPDRTILTGISLEEELGWRDDPLRRLTAERAGMRIARLIERQFDVEPDLTVSAAEFVTTHLGTPLSTMSSTNPSRAGLPPIKFLYYAPVFNSTQAT